MVVLGLAHPWAQANLQRYMMPHAATANCRAVSKARAGGCSAAACRFGLRPSGPCSWPPALWPRGSTGTLSNSADPEDAERWRVCRHWRRSRREVRHQDAYGHRHRRNRRERSCGHSSLSGVSSDCLSLVALGFALWRYRRHVAAAHRPSLSHLPALHRSCLVVHDGSFHRHRRSGLRHLRAVKRRPYSGQRRYPAAT